MATDPVIDQAQAILQEMRDQPRETQYVDQALATVMPRLDPPPSNYDLRDWIFKEQLDLEWLAIQALAAEQEPAPPLEPSNQEWADFMQDAPEQPPNSPISRISSEEVASWVNEIDWDCWEDLPPLESAYPPSPLPAPPAPLPASPRLSECDPTHPEFNFPLGVWDLTKVTSPRHLIGEPMGPAAQDMVAVAMAEVTQERDKLPRPPSLNVTFQDYPLLTVPPESDFLQFKSGRSPRGQGETTTEAADSCRGLQRSAGTWG